MTIQPKPCVPSQELLVSASILAASTGAYATPVRFENDAGLDWYFTTIDLTQSSNDQQFESAFEADA